MMNKRIKELAKQAGWKYGGSSRVQDMEKFAELIIKECAEMAGNLSPHRDLAISAIKEHFGVE